MNGGLRVKEFYVSTTVNVPELSKCKYDTLYINEEIKKICYRGIEIDVNRYMKLETFVKVIKRKHIDFRLLKKCDDTDTYNYLYAQRHGYEPDYMDNQLTETEFNLLKEMLK